MPERVFVYGSLKTGFEHHDQMEGAELLGAASLSRHRLVLYEESYPALVSSESGDRVDGEVFAVDSEHLKRLDRFEDCPELYQRIRVELDDGRSAWTYVISAESGGRYPTINGPWLGRTR